LHNGFRKITSDCVKEKDGAGGWSVTRGRPRSEQVHEAILTAALEEVSAVGFRAGVAKTTIYRRWPNKAAVVMDAFLAHLGPDTDFPETERGIESMRLQLRAQARAFRGKYGKVVKALLGEAQFDPELALAFSERWRIPRRRVATEMIRRAIEEGDIRHDIDIDVAMDMLYAPLYYRLQIKSGPLSDAFADQVFEQVIAGLGKSERK
jgi:AcrR family transcriptional regulator